MALFLHPALDLLVCCRRRNIYERGRGGSGRWSREHAIFCVGNTTIVASVHKLGKQGEGVGINFFETSSAVDRLFHVLIVDHGTKWFGPLRDEGWVKVELALFTLSADYEGEDGLLKAPFPSSSARNMLVREKMTYDLMSMGKFAVLAITSDGAKFEMLGGL